mgnify:CR=1 FL=1
MLTKLKPQQLVARGFSARSERWLNTSTGETISKRQYQKSLSKGQFKGYAPTPKGEKRGQYTPQQKNPKYVALGKKSAEYRKAKKAIGETNYKKFRILENPPEEFEYDDRLAYLREVFGEVEYGSELYYWLRSKLGSP